MSTWVAIVVASMAAFIFGMTISRWNVIVLMPAIVLVVGIVIVAGMHLGLGPWVIAAVAMSAAASIQVGYPAGAFVGLFRTSRKSSSPYTPANKTRTPRLYVVRN